MVLDPQCIPTVNSRSWLCFTLPLGFQVITREEFARAMGQAGKFDNVDKDFSVLVDLSVVR